MAAHNLYQRRSPALDWERLSEADLQTNIRCMATEQEVTDGIPYADALQRLLTTLPTTVAKRYQRLQDGTTTIHVTKGRLKQAAPTQSRKGAETAMSAWEVIEKLAAERVRDGLSPTIEQAVADVAAEHPDLRKQYAQDGPPVPLERIAKVVPRTNPAYVTILTKAEALVRTREAPTLQQGVVQVVEQSPALYDAYKQGFQALAPVNLRLDATDFLTIAYTGNEPVLKGQNEYRNLSSHSWSHRCSWGNWNANSHRHGASL